MDKGLAVAVYLAVFAGPGCGPEFVPEVNAPGQKTGYAGELLSIDLGASSRPGDHVSFDYDAVKEDTAQMVALDKRAARFRPTLNVKADGASAIFLWLPLAQDVGTWHFTFRASVDGGYAGEQQVKVIVQPGAPVAARFLEPENGGTSLDLSTGPCSQIDLLVDSPLSSMGIKLTFSPSTPNAKITQSADDPFSGTLKFCPSAEQQKQSNYSFTFSAMDGTKNVATKSFLITLVGTPH